MGRDNGGMGGSVIRNMHKGHMDKAKGGMIKGRKWEWWDWGEQWWGKGDNCN